MHDLHELKEKLIKELEEYSENGKYSKEDVETIKYLASAVDHLCNIIDDGEYSMDNRMDGRMRYSRTYDGRNSYARNRRRDSMGRYSRKADMDDFMMSLGEMMGDFPEDAKRDAEKLMRKLDEMR